MAEGIPSTPMMGRYENLRRVRGEPEGRGLLKQQLQTAEEALANPAALVAEFDESVAIAGDFFSGDNRREGGFYGSERTPLAHDPGTGTTPQVGALFQSYGDSLWQVADAPELSFRYLERELVVTQAKGLRFGDGRVSSAGPRIDLLLAATDGVPIVGELKIAGDADPYLALVQALAAAAYLAPPAQVERLRAHDQGGHLAAELNRLDIYLVAAQEIEGSEIRRKILDVVEQLAARLAPLLEQSIRRIAAVRLSWEPDPENDRRSVSKVFSAEAF